MQEKRDMMREEWCGKSCALLLSLAVLETVHHELDDTLRTKKLHCCWWERQCNWCLADSAHCSHPYVVGTFHSCCFALLSIFALSFLAFRLNSFAVASARSFLVSSTSSTKTTASTPWYVPTAFSFTFLPLALDAFIGVGPSAVPLLASWIDFLSVSWLQLFDTCSKLMICSLTWM